MKLILAQPYLNLRGGVERVILEVARRYDAKIYTLEYNRSETFEEFKNIDVEIIGKDVPLADRLPYRASQGLRYGYNFYNIKVKEDYDVINPHISPSEWIRHNNDRVLWYCHTPPREVYDLYETRMQNRSYKQKLLYAALVGTYKLMSRGITKKIERIATNSNTTNARIKKYYGREAAVINPGLDAREFMNDGDNRYFFYPSRIVINKRQDYVISAFSQFTKRFKAKGRYKLILAGTLSRDPEHQKYFDKLKAMSKGLNVQFRTNIDDKELKGLYAGASAVLFAAINEDYGYIPIESMASSKPIISVKEGGPTETIQDGKTGFLVSSASEMADKMLYVAEHGDIAERMGKAGRKLVERRYSWDAFFDKFDPILKDVAKS